MCGIAGLIQLEGVSDADLEPLLHALAHRGPDGQGTYINRTGQVGLVHTRLAIVDLEGGKQPFVSRDGREGLVANGEIYNHQEIRRHLDDYHFDTQSDCEVILPLTKRFGREAYPKLRGMFAYGVWLGVHRTLTLGRDPFGIKPLHYWCDGKRFAFASEIKALLALPFIQATLNRDALWDFFNLRYCPGEETLFDGIKRLPPASVMQVKLEDDHLVTQITSFQGDLPTLSAEGDGTSEDDVATAIEESLSAHMMADVPVGAYLSGGLDSSTLTTLAARKNSHLHTFTLGFGEESDENEDAARLAQSLGTHHHDLISSDELFDHLPAAVMALEEPKINGVQGFLLAQQTRPHVKVALSGLGGDELFLGYSRNEIHHRFARLARWMKRMPIAGRVFENAALAGFRAFGGLRHQHSLRGLLYLARLGEASVAAHLLRNAFDSHLRAIGSPFSREFAAEQSHRPSLGDRFAKDFARYAEGQDANALLVGAVQHELTSKLPNDYLLNEDRVSMAHGLEVRVPFL
ncbi:MAG: asparagine synthase (glutamine-hydrolyzing), partial [Planctomycetes bacterium]|nr:asparagine synthase (glutamine-hydrolyzing) [Planctomycetota bacterium]